ncbi:hypothetical protein XMM354_003316 [Aliiroseovarius sp. xm-m-354]|nr:hypothetical protein [Aliiroseovarius sp. xm-m-354]
MIRVEGKDPVHGAAKDRVHLMIFGGHGKAHAQEVRRIVQIIARIDEGLADGVFIGHRRNGRHFGDQADRSDLALVFVIDVGAVVIEGRHRTDHAYHDSHRMRITTETAEEVHHLFVQHGVVGHQALEFFQRFGAGQLTVEQQITYFEVMRLRRKLLNRIAPVQQNAFVTVDESDGAVAGRC